MNHKMIAALLATLMLFSPIIVASVGTVSAAAAVATGTFQYTLNSDGSAVEITGYNGTGASMVIPSVIAGKPVTSIGEQAFCNYTALTTVTIPNGVLTIGAGAFQNCYSLTTLTIPNSVSTVGSGAFYNVGLRSVVIPNSMTVIEDDLFFDCYSMTSVTIPISITSIGNYSFGNCYQLNNVVIPNSVTSIGEGAFFNCGLHTAVIPQSVTAIEDRCFQGCYSLTSVTMPVSLTQVGNFSFYNCYSLSSITIPANVSSLGDYSFGNCYNLISATIAGSVTCIGAGAFSNCYGLGSITFHGNAPFMGSGWKAGCSGNTTVHYYQGATGFNESSWSGMIVLCTTSPNVPQNLTAVPRDGSVKLDWKVPSGFVGMPNLIYLVYQNGTYLQRVASNTLTISGLKNGLTYNFTVVLSNTKGNLLNSTSVDVKLPILEVAVSGSATDIDGNPIANATVTLGSYAAVLTNDYGFFVIKGVKGGSYGLNITKDGYATVAQNVTVMAAKNTNLDVFVLNTTESSAGSGSGSGDMTIIFVAVGGVGAAVAVYFLFFRKRRPKARRKK